MEKRKRQSGHGPASKYRLNVTIMLVRSPADETIVSLCTEQKRGTLSVTKISLTIAIAGLVVIIPCGIAGVISMIDAIGKKRHKTSSATRG